MKLYIYSQPGRNDSADDILSFIELIRDSGLDYRINSDYARQEQVAAAGGIPEPNIYETIGGDDVAPDAFMLSVGGDGTFLEAVRRLRGLPMPILGVNMGRLGFLAQMQPDDLRGALSELEKGNYVIQKRPLLKITGSACEGMPFPYAFNEFTLHRHEASMIDIEVCADNDLLAVYRGDGVITATPTGSTAYSLSAGGPILTPDCAVLVLTPLAAHNLSIRPVVLPEDTVLTFRVSTRGGKAIAFLDNTSFPVRDGELFRVEKAKFSAFLINFQNISFYDTLRNKMMWGLDKRDSAR